MERPSICPVILETIPNALWCVLLSSDGRPVEFAKKDEFGGINSGTQRYLTRHSEILEGLVSSWSDDKNIGRVNSVTFEFHDLVIRSIYLREKRIVIGSKPSLTDQCLTDLYELIQTVIDEQ